MRHSPRTLTRALLLTQAALAFKPEASWALVDGALQVMT